MKRLNRAASTFNASAVVTASAALFLAAAAFHGSAHGQTRDADRQKQSTAADAVLAPASGPQSSPSGTSGAAEAAGGAAATVTEKLKEAGKEVAETTRRVVRLIAEKLPGTKTQTDDGASADAKVIREGDTKAGSKGATSGSTSSDDQKK